MAKKQTKKEISQDGYIAECYKCGKREILIGPRGRGLCEECIAKSNAPYKNGTRGFINDFGLPKQEPQPKKTTKKTTKK